MTFDHYLPADCQGEDPAFPWNQPISEDEPESLGSDCCEAGVIEEDGVLKCFSCGEPCEEVFETEEALQERLQEEINSSAEDAAISRWEDSRSDNY